MSLIEIKVEPDLLKRLLLVFTRIADALERAYPEPQIREMPKPYGPEALFQFSPEEEWQIEEEEERQRNQGLRP